MPKPADRAAARPQATALDAPAGARETTQATLERARTMLRELIEISGLSPREVERRLRRSDAGVDLGRLLNGKVELGVRHVLDVTRVIGMHPQEFFTMACGRPRETSPLLRRVSALARVEAGINDLEEELARQRARGEAEDGASGEVATGRPR